MNQHKKFFGLPFLFSALVIYLGGFIELYSIKTKGIFCAMQTGNLLNIFVSIIDKKNMTALLSLLVLVVFLLGCFIAELYRLYFPRKHQKYYYLSVLLLQSLFLLPLLFFPLDGSGVLHGESININDAVTDSFLSLYGAFHFISFREENSFSYTPTMMTNMMKNIMVSMAKGIKEKNKDMLLLGLSYFLLVISFILGALSFYFIFIAFSGKQREDLIQYLPFFVIGCNLLITPLSLAATKTMQ